MGPEVAMGATTGPKSVVYSEGGGTKDGFKPTIWVVVKDRFGVLAKRSAHSMASGAPAE